MLSRFCVGAVYGLLRPSPPFVCPLPLHTSCTESGGAAARDRVLGGVAVVRGAEIWVEIPTAEGSIRAAAPAPQRLPARFPGVRPHGEEEEAQLRCSCPCREKPDDSTPQRPERTLFEFKDQPDSAAEPVSKDCVVAALFWNKEMVLIAWSSRHRIIYWYRNLMQNVVSLLPHTKKDIKVESTQSKGRQLNALVELWSCSSGLFFELLHMLLRSLHACLMEMVQAEENSQSLAHLSAIPTLVNSHPCTKAIAAPPPFPPATAQRCPFREHRRAPEAEATPPTTIPDRRPYPRSCTFIAPSPNASLQIRILPFSFCLVPTSYTLPA